jgi:hypothetical protein
MRLGTLTRLERIYHESKSTPDLSGTRKSARHWLDSNGDLGSFSPTWTMGRLEVSTGSGTPSNESSTMREALQFCLLNQKRFAEFLLNYRLQIKLCAGN